MSEKIYKVFEEVELKAQLLSKYWHNFSTEISEHLPDTYYPELEELTDKLEIAIDNLVNELRNPTLTLATTGTTSSGKSTLVNLLCGAEIVPVAVSEMSAGTVTIEYSNQKSLKIHETPGALWECGEWTGISDERIYQRLHDVMRKYIDNRETQPNLACPQSTISYPFRLIKESKLELPIGVKVRIMDLPGLAYVGDEGNANVIQQCREALCLVTYNSAETDRERVRSLLQEVVNQVKHLGGSPARMLFVLNRIDVFSADRNWTETENRFVENAIRSIKHELTEQLREYTEEIENLQVVKLSTWPALLALQIKNNDDSYSTIASRTALNNFLGLIDENILDDLSFNTTNWSRHDRNRVADALWQKSYAEEFQQHLREHISQHFPRLVIPQAIDRFNVAAGNPIAEWALQTTTELLNNSEERYREKCNQILLFESTLIQFLQGRHDNLNEYVKKLEDKTKRFLTDESEEDPLLYLNEVLSEIKNIEDYKLLKEDLYLPYGWQQELCEVINQLLKSVANSLENGKVILNMNQSNNLNLKLLENCLNQIIELGYTSYVAKAGINIKAETEEDKERLKYFKLKSDDLAIQLTLATEDILKQILNKMYEAVVDFFNFYLCVIQKNINNILPEITINFSYYQFSKIDAKHNFDLNFKANFSITESFYEEKIKEAKTRRNWFELWLREETYYETRLQTASSDNAEIPSIDKLIEDWQLQLIANYKTIVKEISRLLLEQIKDSQQNLDKILKDIINRYQERLDLEYTQITTVYKIENNLWQPMQQKAQNLAKDFHSLGVILKA